MIEWGVGSSGGSGADVELLAPGTVYRLTWVPTTAVYR